MADHPTLHVVGSGIEGYFYDEIVQYLGPERGQAFQQWMTGQTMTLYQGRGLVYAWDYERFRRGLAAYD
jgi:hypothetical protein